MRGAFLVSDSPDIYRDVSVALVDMGAVAYEEVVQLRDDQGRLFTVDLLADSESGWEWREGPFVVRGDAEPPEMVTATACLVQCRWEDLFTSIVHQLAAVLPEPAWVLDGNDVLWPAALVDEREVRL
jgi:hypothetical protein